jgi:hypothetical protein
LLFLVLLQSRSNRKMFLEIWPMFHRGTLVPGVSVHHASTDGVPTLRLSAFRGSVSGMAVLIGITLLASPSNLLAQRGGGGGGGGGGAPGAGGGRNTTPIICVHDCPSLRDELDTEDSLKNFRRAMAVQATAEQRAAFARIAQYTQAASDLLQAFRESLLKSPAPSPLSDGATAVDQAIGKARAGNQNFLTSLSVKQKPGLEDTAKKLGKADSELDKQIKALNQILQTKPVNEQIASSADVLDKLLAGFQNEQLALGREMSILFDPAGQDVTFSLPAVTNSINVAGLPLSIPASGAISRTSTATSAATPADNGRNLFSLKQVADLSDLQQDITAILRSELNRSPRCGERIQILQATLTPLEPASLVVARLHFERWVCPPGPQSPIEVAAGEGTIEVKLTLSVEPTAEQTTEPNAALQLVSQITRVDASGFVRDSLRSGDLGVSLGEQIAASLLSALQKGADIKASLPPAAQQSAILQKARFQNDGADQLSLVLDGQLRLSDEQTQQFAAQLKQRLSAQGTSPQ